MIGYKESTGAPLNNLKADIEEDIKDLTELLTSKKTKLELIKTVKQVSNKELYNGIEQLFVLNIADGAYEKELGGDGRSAPSHQDAFGKIATVTIKEGLYIDYKQEDVIRSYIHELYKSSHIKIIQSIK